MSRSGIPESSPLGSDELEIDSQSFLLAYCSLSGTNMDKIFFSIVNLISAFFATDDLQLPPWTSRRHAGKHAVLA